MLRLGREREQISVVLDQIGTPTYTLDLALAALALSEMPTMPGGIYHFSNEGVCSWYDFARAIFKAANLPCRVVPIESKDYPTPTSRPTYSVLNKAKIKATLGISIQHWEDALADCLENQLGTSNK
jgi:dTDP-4-dehydrorhamnose reductase